MIVAALTDEEDLDEAGNKNWFRARVDKLVDVSTRGNFFGLRLRSDVFSYSKLHESRKPTVDECKSKHPVYCLSGR